MTESEYDVEADEELPAPVKQFKESIEARIEAEEVSRELLEKVQPIIEARRKLTEALATTSDNLGKLVEAVNNLSQQFVEVKLQIDDLYKVQKEEFVKTLEFYRKVEAQF